MPEEIKDGQAEEVQEEQTQSEEQLEELSTSQEPTEDQGADPQLPEDAKERTKQEFEKLKAHNAELKRQLEERQSLPSVLDYLGGDVPQVSPQVRQQYMQPPQVQMPQYNQIYQQPYNQQAPQLVDEQGLVNADVLQSQLNRAEEARIKAEEAERRAIEAQQRIARFEQDNETRALYQQFPELDPMNENFNREAYDLVKNELTSQIVSTGKRNAIEAANKMSKYFRKQQPTQVQEQRKQVTSVSGNMPRQPQTDLDELRLQSRNNPNAVAERLKRLGM